MLEIFNNCTIVVAHPDDEVLGCGGLLSVMARHEMSVNILYMNDGNSFRGKYEPLVIKKQIESVCNFYGNVKNFEVLDFRAISFDTHGENEFSNIIRTYLRETKSETILIHDENDLNVDHRILNKACLVASRGIRNILSFPVLSSSELNPGWTFTPNFYVPLQEEDVDRKIAAMAFYEKELKSMPISRGAAGIHAWARFWGLRSSLNFAECFKVLKITV